MTNRYGFVWISILRSACLWANFPVTYLEDVVFYIESMTGISDGTTIYGSPRTLGQSKNC